jgi:hypothetical protein
MKELIGKEVVLKIKGKVVAVYELESGGYEIILKYDNFPFFIHIFSGMIEEIQCE